MLTDSDRDPEEEADEHYCIIMWDEIEMFVT